VAVTRDVGSILYVKLTGSVDDRIHRFLCSGLEMEEKGRLDDDFDQLFGDRVLSRGAG